MAKTTFSKIIELPKNQVLIVKEYNDEDDSFYVRQTTDIKGLRMTISFGFKTAKQCDKCFNDYNNENAEKFIKTITDFLKEN